MSEDGRRMFLMDTALQLIANEGGNEVNELLSFAISRPVCECCAPAVAPIVKGWLYSLHPKFMEYPYDPEKDTLALWISEQKKRLGVSVSIPAMSATEVAGIHTMMDMVQEAFDTAEAKTEETAAAHEAVAAAEAEAKALAPFKAKAEELEKKLTQVEEKVATLQKELSEAKAEAAAFNGKVAINENEIEKAIKDILTKTVGSMSFAAGAEAGGDATPSSATDPAESNTDSAGDVPDSFGFGASGPNDDGFGF